MENQYNHIIQTALSEMGIKNSVREISFLNKYLDILFESNRRLNLVGTRDKNGILVRHLLDSASLLGCWQDIIGTGSKKIIDVGTGAGLPGMVLAGFKKDCNFWLMDDSLKKIEFLRESVKKLGLKNISIIRDRAENAARKEEFRQVFDVVVARAVARFNVLAELLIPFCRINGKIIFYKSRKAFNEANENLELIELLGGEIEFIREAGVPYLDEYRVFLVIRKITDTPSQFPRKYSKIIKGKG